MRAIRPSAPEGATRSTLYRGQNPDAGSESHAVSTCPLMRRRRTGTRSKLRSGGPKPRSASFPRWLTSISPKRYRTYAVLLSHGLCGSLQVKWYQAESGGRQAAVFLGRLVHAGPGRASILGSVDLANRWGCRAWAAARVRERFSATPAAKPQCKFAGV